jgi:hypothetical protein
MESIRLFLEAAGQWLVDKGFVITITTMLSAAGAFIVWYITAKVIPNATSTGIKYLAKVMSKMFGGNEEDVADFIKQVPIVKEMHDWQEQIAIQNELKLIELKSKLSSPYLTDAERIAYKSEYDYIFDKFRKHISQRTLDTLEAIEKAADQKFKL